MHALEKLLEVLDGMLPTIIVCAGRFVSEQNRDRESYESIRGYFEQFGNIIREKQYDYLRDHTQWIFIPALGDPGQLDVMP